MRVLAGALVTALSAAVIGVSLGAAPPRQTSSSADTAGAALLQMVEAERAFARLANERSVREAFLTYLADDSISLQPFGNAKQQWRERPAPPPDAKRATLEWAPRTGDIAAAGDLGWLTGDFRMTPPTGEARHGCYFSVWERQPNGDWRVRLDVGADAPGPVPFPAPGFVRAGSPAAATSRPAAASVDDLKAADRDLAAYTAAGSSTAALLARLAADGRLHRPGRFPLVGKRAIQEAFAATPPPDIRYDPGAEARVAASGDLGWTLGRYRPKSGDGESGAYVRVWKRDAQNRWTIAADVTQPDRQP